MNKRTEIRLNNILFPLWLLMLIPTAWLVILPGNFIIDSIVLLISMATLHIADKKQMYKKTILKIWFFGFISDIVGALYILGNMYLFELDIRGDEFYLTIPAVLISAILIFLLNYLISFKGYDRKTKFKLAISFAIFTAPYTFLIPISWIYM